MKNYQQRPSTITAFFNILSLKHTVDQFQTALANPHNSNLSECSKFLFKSYKDLRFKICISDKCISN